MMVWMTKTCSIHWWINKSFEVFHSMHFYILDSSATKPNKCTLFIYYKSILCFSYMFRCTSHHLQGEFMYCFLKNPFFLHSYYLWYSGCVLNYKRFAIIFFTKQAESNDNTHTHACAYTCTHTHTHTHTHTRAHTCTHARTHL